MKLWLFPTFFVLAVLHIHSSSAVKTYVEIPDSTQLNGTKYSVTAFSPKAFIRSGEFELNSTQCVQYSFKLLERRVRLYAYTCQLSEGGFCTLDKFSNPHDKEGCTYMRPWTHKVDSWSFYFVLEKRPRTFGKAYHARQARKFKRQTSLRREMSTEPFGHLELYGVVPCSDVCGNEEELRRLGSQADNTYYRGRPNRLQY